MLLTSCLITFLVPLAFSKYDVRDDIHFDFEVLNVAQTASDRSNSLRINTRFNEVVDCKIPSELKDTKNNLPLSTYNGPNELDLLKPIFQSEKCSFKLEPYWAYEICHSKSIRQFHGQLDDPNPEKQYYLGYYSPYMNLKSLQEQGSDTIFLEGQEYPYFQVNYTSGDFCDLIGTRRSTTILYICNQVSLADIYQITEVESCKYQIIVLTKYLCSHPKYKVRVNYVNQITCYTNGPEKIKDFDDYLYNLDMWNRGDYTSIDALMDSTSLKNIKIEAKREKGGIVYRIRMPDEDESIDFEETPTVPDTILRKSLEHLQAESKKEREEVVSKESGHPKTAYTAISPITKADFEDFLRGRRDKCLVSGVGWWNQMLCFRHAISQYHVDEHGKEEIVLGRWDQSEHMKEYQKNINLRANDENNLFYYYMNGDLCENKMPRKVILHLSCDPEADLLQQYFQEDPVCVYFIRLKSAVLCKMIPKAHPETGVFLS